MFSGIGATLIPIARAIAKRISGEGAGTRHEMDAVREEVMQLRNEMDGVQRRLADVDEIQNRLDFTERLLAQAREKGQLNAPKER